jgi:glycosyltransferase involved in cell wall biosynthesis
MKVLMSAYACEPNRGSEAGVGWNWAVQAALHGHEVHVITRSNNRGVIERELGANPVPGLTFHYHDLPSPLRSWKKRSGYYGLLAYYYLWQLGAWPLARRLHRAYGFDLAHHITFVNDWMPSGVGWIGVPFIWGPVGGSTNVLPSTMREFIPPHARRYEWIRRVAQRTLRSGDPFVAVTRRRADLILTYTREARDGIPYPHRRRARAITHIGISASEAPVPMNVPGSNESLTIASGGRLVHWKGFDLLIEGYAQYRNVTGASARLLITGDGPFRPYLEDRIRSLRMGDSLQLVGNLPTREDVYQVVGSADLYALPTLRDGPPVGILEAMLAGRPILCLDRGATAELVPAGVGFKIAVRSRSQVVRDIATALARADAHRDELASMGQAARGYALGRHDWRGIGDAIDAIYREMASEGWRPSAAGSSKRSDGA